MNIQTPHVIDLTHSLGNSTPTHPLDERPTLIKNRTLQRDHYNDWQLCTGMHVGTHIDGPGHLTDSKELLSNKSINSFIGNGYLIDARNKQIDASLLQHFPKEDGLIVLIMTGYDKHFNSPEYFTDHPVIAPEFAEALVNYGVKMVGIDFFSPDHYPFAIHQTLFAHNILLIENLANLEELIEIENFWVVALPLKTETDSALARVIAISY